MQPYEMSNHSLILVMLRTNSLTPGPCLGEMWISYGMNRSHHVTPCHTRVCISITPRVTQIALEFFRRATTAGNDVMPGGILGWRSRTNPRVLIDLSVSVDGSRRTASDYMGCNGSVVSEGGITSDYIWIYTCYYMFILQLQLSLNSLLTTSYGFIEWVCGGTTGAPAVRLPAGTWILGSAYVEVT